MKAWIIGFIIIVVIAVGLFLITRSGGSDDSAQPPVTVVRGTVEQTAVATGRIQPAYEVVVRSQFSGLVARRYAELGDRVNVGDPLVGS